MVLNLSLSTIKVTPKGVVHWQLTISPFDSLSVTHMVSRFPAITLPSIRATNWWNIGFSLNGLSGSPIKLLSDCPDVIKTSWTRFIRILFNILINIIPNFKFLIFCYSDLNFQCADLMWFNYDQLMRSISKTN